MTPIHLRHIFYGMPYFRTLVVDLHLVSEVKPVYRHSFSENFFVHFFGDHLALIKSTVAYSWAHMR